MTFVLVRRGEITRIAEIDLRAEVVRLVGENLRADLVGFVKLLVVDQPAELPFAVVAFVSRDPLREIVGVLVFVLLILREVIAGRLISGGRVRHPVIDKPLIDRDLGRIVRLLRDDRKLPRAGDSHHQRYERREGQPTT